MDGPVSKRPGAAISDFLALIVVIKLQRTARGIVNSIQGIEIRHLQFTENLLVDASLNCLVSSLAHRLHSLRDETDHAENPDSRDRHGDGDLDETESARRRNGEWFHREIGELEYLTMDHGAKRLGLTTRKR